MEEKKGKLAGEKRKGKASIMILQHAVLRKKRHWHDEMHHRGLAKASGKDETGNRWI